MPSSRSSNMSAAESIDTPNTSPPPADNDTTKEEGISEAMRAEEEEMMRKRQEEQTKRDKEMAKERRKDIEGGSKNVDKKFKALEHLLNQSKLFSTIMLSQMQKQEEVDAAKDEKGRKRAQKRDEKAEEVAANSQRRATRTAAAIPEPTAKRSRGRPSKVANGDAAITLPTRGRATLKKGDSQNNKISDYLKKEDVQAKAGKVSVSEALQEAAAESEVKPGDIGMQELRTARQPELVSGGIMRKYQLEGLEWLISLYENGLNGVLADEMGLGKTIQTISFIAFLREKKSYGPFLIAAPLSTTSNWVEEFRKFTPDIPVVLYHGSKPEREAIRNKHFKRPGSPEFPVVITSYEICMNDRKFLANFGWKFIIIDEGHRIKNLNCRLIRELQSYQSANRLLITGTPLQNNLTELWSLLHFLMPEIFDKLESFESWFDFSELKDKQGYAQILNKERQQKLVASLHAILKPFLLRRVKADVEKMLPKKREYILYAPLTAMQRELYQAILDGTSRSYLEDKAVERLSASGIATPLSARSSSANLKRKLATGSGNATPNKSAKTSRESTPANSARGRRNKRKNYEEMSDSKYFADLQNKGSDDDISEPSSEAEEEQERAATLALAKRQIAQKKLQNPVMQLRLCCDSPYNFFNPADVEENGEPDETLVSTSGKMMLLDSLLPALFRENHKVLIFSQFKTQLDLLDQYADMRGWKCCRIDGSVPQMERQAQITAFNAPTTSKNKKDVANLFLLSTRAGGQGINLAAADTVILFDSDWNPQQDLQAQDRAHRIGQTRNVIVYRLATRGTVEQTLLETAEGKRRLEKLVIRKGGLREDTRSKQGKEEFDELQALLRRSDGQRYDVEEGTGAVFSEQDLKILIDRSEEAYERAAKGLDAGDAFKAVEMQGDTGLLESLKA
ncbi:SNF2 family helicase/ATPase-like protein PasG [Tothia fuscella]|uniref:SNF2 family helicase/ATPase-like protein PasG n=1 Tax=Tothia fuscella TaxID=1048955 RepID=A0A9P4NQF3_9PEZI|nr:SNF2 family helicase/ATPase-like protein PasG [Tothia fuscella]